MFSWFFVKTKVTPTKQKAFPDWNLLNALDVRLGNAVASTLEISPDDKIIEQILLTIS
jgi:hypothetical protein